MSGMRTCCMCTYFPLALSGMSTRGTRADELVAGDRLLRRDAGELGAERLVAEELAIADRAGRVAIDGHHPLFHRETSRLHAEPRRGKRQQRRPRLGGGRAHLRPATMNGGA